MTYQISSVEDVGNDILRVTATVDPDPNNPEADPVTVTADGWVSATVNYYPPQAYNPTTGNRHPQWEDPEGSGQFVDQPRPMTPGEVDAYCRTLIDPLLPPQ